MLQRVEMEGITLPRLYVAENKADVKLARDRGIPYVRWTQGVAELIRCILRPLLAERFPYIKWDQVLGRKKAFRTEVIQVCGHEAAPESKVLMLDKKSFERKEERDKAFLGNQENKWLDGYQENVESEVADIAEETREFTDGTNMDIEETYTYRGKISDYCSDVMSCVNLEVLQKLGMLPHFLGDITDCIKRNFANNMRWTEGYNKKLGVPIGKFGAQGYLRNLIILDISGSIPRGISATMISLIDTLRSQVDADLIITGSRSVYYESGEELPSPQRIRNAIGPGNEASDFMNIARHHIAGREYGHVISFGDNDSPYYFRRYDYDADKSADIDACFTGAKVHEVHHYHTTCRDTQTGYAKWCKAVSPNVIEHFDTTWCKVIEE